MEWRMIAGYGGFYEVSRLGEVRSYRSCWGRLPSSRLLTPYKRQPRGKGRRSNRVFVKLTDQNGRAREVPLVNIVVDVWKGGRPPGMVAYHINGDTTDNRAANIGFITPRELGEMTGHKSRRRPVAKIFESGEVAEVYRSAREAAAQNHMSYQTVMDRCNNKIKNPYALDGFNYQWDDWNHCGSTAEGANCRERRRT